MYGFRPRRKHQGSFQLTGMENAVLAGLLQILQAVIPERCKPPVKYKYIQAQINTQVTADHVQHIRIAAMAVEKNQFFEAAG